MTLNIIQALTEETYHTKDYPGFYADHTLDPQVFSIEVQGLGHISMPFDVHVVESLLKISSPAKFGLREKTLLDKKVRDTHEIGEHKKVWGNPIPLIPCFHRAFLRYAHRFLDLNNSFSSP